MIHLIGNLYSVEVPSDHESKISILNWLCIRHKKERIWQVVFKLEENFKILGEVTKDDFSFDVEPYVLEPIELNQEDYEGNMVLKSFYWDYNLEYYWLTSFEESYRTLLESKGIDLNKENVKLIILEKL